MGITEFLDGNNSRRAFVAGTAALLAGCQSNNTEKQNTPTPTNTSSPTATPTTTTPADKEATIGEFEIVGGFPNHREDLGETQLQLLLEEPNGIDNIKLENTAEILENTANYTESYTLNGKTRIDSLSIHNGILGWNNQFTLTVTDQNNNQTTIEKQLNFDQPETELFPGAQPELATFKHRATTPATEQQIENIYMQDITETNQILKEYNNSNIDQITSLWPEWKQERDNLTFIQKAVATTMEGIQQKTVGIGGSGGYFEPAIGGIKHILHNLEGKSTDDYHVYYQNASRTDAQEGTHESIHILDHNNNQHIVSEPAIAAA